MNSDTSPNKVGEFFSECSLPFNERDHFANEKLVQNFFENFAVDPKSISKSEPTSELRSFDRPHSGNLVTQSQFLVQN